MFVKTFGVVALLAGITSSLYVNLDSLEFCNIADMSSHVPRGHDSFHERDTAVTLDDYEYVVVGSGPGGSPLAARLALAGHSVLLIDAGGDFGDDLTIQIPALHPFASEYAPIRWDYYVQHYSDPIQQKRDSKLTYQNAAGAMYSGSNPPAGT